MTKFSEPTEDGKKHYVVTKQMWGRETVHVVLAEDATEARYMIVARRRPMEYVVSCRRATPEEVAHAALGLAYQNTGDKQ